jgi:anti-sigma factor RsiW
MSSLDRIVAGVSCREVLAELSDWVDGDLSADRAAMLGRHVAGCDVCESFGGRFGAVVRRLKAAFRGSIEMPAVDVAALEARLAGEYARRRD